MMKFMARAMEELRDWRDMELLDAFAWVRDNAGKIKATIQGRGGRVMYALSIKQPWTWLILNAGKDVENRTWDKPGWVKLPMRVYIHAGLEPASVPSDLYQIIPNWSVREKAESYTWNLLTSWHGTTKKTWREKVALAWGCGAIVGEVTITAWTDGWASGSPWFEGPYGLILDAPQPYETPIPCRGRLGLWVPPEMENIYVS